MSASRYTLSVELTPRARDAVKQIMQRRGMKQKYVVSRAMEWLAQQPDKKQDAVLNGGADDGGSDNVAAVSRVKDPAVNPTSREAPEAEPLA